MAERTPRIVAVDDDALMRELLRLHLSNAGYDVVAAEDAVVAMKCILSRRPDLLIVDVEMPYMNGFEFIAAIKADAHFRDVPVLVLTARTDVDEAAKKCGALACLKKPILLSDLVSALGALLPAPCGRMRLERGTAGAQPVPLALS